MQRRTRSDIQWIIDALERDDSKSRKGIGDAINIDKSGVSRLLSGDRVLKLREAQRIAQYLGVPAPSGFAESEAAFAPAPKASMIPVYRTAKAGGAGPATFRIFRQERPVELKPRPLHCAAAAPIFGVYAQDEAMAPRFKPGELIFADPSRPVAPGDDVLFIAKGAPENGEPALIGELTAASAAQFRYFQHGRKGGFRLSAKSWTAALILKGY